MADPQPHEKHGAQVLALKAVLLAVWAAASFGVCYFARDLQFTIGPWPFGFWMAAQGSVLVFIVIVVAYTVAMSRLDPEEDETAGEGRRA